MSYWADQPGIGVNIVDKLLNYTILTPLSVVEWALVDDGSDKLAETYVFEMVAGTVQKVTNRVRQIIASRNAPGLEHEARLALDETLLRERKAMKEMFTVMEEALLSWANGSKDQAVEEGTGETADEQLIRTWGERWLRVFRRKMAVEEAFLVEVGNKASNEGNVAGNGTVEMEVEV
jgi:nuclear cap-binding protein subunit 1